MLTLYTTEKKLIEICEEGEDWYNIVKRQSDVYICNDSESGEWDVTNNLLLALHRSGTSIIVDNDVLSDIKKDDNNQKADEIVSKKPDDSNIWRTGNHDLFRIATGRISNDVHGV